MGGLRVRSYFKHRLNRVSMDRFGRKIGAKDIDCCNGRRSSSLLKGSAAVRAHARRMPRAAEK